MEAMRDTGCGSVGDGFFRALRLDACGGVPGSAPPVQSERKERGPIRGKGSSVRKASTGSSSCRRFTRTMVQRGAAAAMAEAHREEDKRKRGKMWPQREKQERGGEREAEREEEGGLWR